VVSLSKGLEQGSHLRMTEVIKDVLPGHPAAALTGPNLAKEIMAGRAAASVVATEDLAVATAIQQVLQRGVFRLYMNHDVVGCELGGALKNVIAIAAGVAEGLGVGDNTRAAVITRGLSELTRLGVAMGGEAATFAGLTGLGDLVATCSSLSPSNRKMARRSSMSISRSPSSTRSPWWTSHRDPRLGSRSNGWPASKSPRNAPAIPVTSAARTWRSSARGCTVMPGAPAATHVSTARRTRGSEPPRELRSVATLFTLTERLIMTAAS
jgi:hypothetical protein